MTFEKISPKNNIADTREDGNGKNKENRSRKNKKKFNEKGSLNRRDLIKAGLASAGILAGAKIVSILKEHEKMDFGEGLSDWDFGEETNENSSENNAEKQVVITEEQEEIRRSNEMALAKILESQFIASGRVDISLKTKQRIADYWESEYGEGGRQANGLNMALKRMAPYYKEIKEVFRNVSAEKGINIPEEFIYLAIPESHCDAKAGSKAGARGFYQLMPRTAKSYGLRIDKDVDERLNPIRNARAAAEYLVDLYLNDIGNLKNDWTENDERLRWILTLARYNGAKYFREFKKEVKEKRYDVSYSDYLRFREKSINDYIEEVLGRGYFKLRVSSVRKLKEIIKKYHLTDAEVVELNGGERSLRRKIRLRSKIKIPLFKENILYKVGNGDVLEKIAGRYKTSIADIKRRNGLTSDKILPGQILRIKVGGDIYDKKINSVRLLFETDLQSSLENLNYPEKFFAVIGVMKKEGLFLRDEDDHEEKSPEEGISKGIPILRSEKKKPFVYAEKRKIKKHN